MNTIHVVSIMPDSVAFRAVAFMLGLGAIPVPIGRLPYGAIASSRAMQVNLSQ